MGTLIGLPHRRWLGLLRPSPAQRSGGGHAVVVATMVRTEGSLGLNEATGSASPTIVRLPEPPLAGSAGGPAAPMKASRPPTPRPTIAVANFHLRA